MKRLLSFILFVLFTIATTAQEVTIEKVRPGELGKLILKQVDDLRNVESLTIKSGTLGYDDFKLLENTMQYMKVLDLGGLRYLALIGVDLQLHRVLKEIDG